MSIAALDLDLEVFNGPFDLLLTLVLKEEIDLLEVDLAEVVLAYVEHLEQAGELDLERSEEHTSELQSRQYLVCRLLLEKKIDASNRQSGAGGVHPLHDDALARHDLVAQDPA